MPENSPSPTPVGNIISIQGSAQALSNGEVRELSSDSSVFQGDTLMTAQGSQMEVQFKDHTSLSMGEDSEININSYVYNPGEPGSSDFLLQMTKGVFRTITGEIAEQTPDNFKLQSPLANIGIRGTTVVSEVRSTGEKHGVEDIGDGKVLVVQDRMGNIQFISDPLKIIDFFANQPIQPARPLTRSELNHFQSSAPMQDEVPGEGEQEEAPDSDNPEDQEEGDQGSQEGDAQDDGEPEPTDQTTEISLDAPDYTFLGVVDFTDMDAPVFFAADNDQEEEEPGHQEEESDTLFGDNNTDDDTQLEADPEPTGLTKTGTSASETLTGAEGNDYIDGAGGNDTLVGEAGDDTLTGGAGVDQLSGDAGNDLFIYSSSVADNSGTAEVIDGCTGTDTILVTGDASATINFSNDTITDVEILELTKDANNNADANGQNLKLSDTQFADFTNMNGENIGDDAGDTIIMTDKLKSATLNSTIINGGLQINLAGGNSHTFTLAETVMDHSDDLLYINASNLSSGDNIDFDGSAETTGKVRIFGSNFNDTITGTANADALFGVDGIDSISGGDGDDSIQGGAGMDELFGGAGNDTFIFDSTNLNYTGAGETVDGGGDNTTDTIKVTGNNANAIDFSNTTISNVKTLELTQDSGNTQLTMTKAQIGGFSEINAAHDGSSGDTITMSEFITSDMLDNTTINGGLNIILKAVAEQSQALTLKESVMDSAGDLLCIDGTALASTGPFSFDGSAETTGRVKVAGGMSGDSITGTANADTLFGEGGDDTLTGGAGADSLTGGADSDTFQFTDYASVDKVTDFLQGPSGDKLSFKEGSLGLGANFSADGADTFNGTASGGNNIDPTAYKVVGLTTDYSGSWDLADVATFINGSVNGASMGTGNDDDTYFVIGKGAGVTATAKVYYWDGDVDNPGSNTVDASELDLIASLDSIDHLDIGNMVDTNFSFT